MGKVSKSQFQKEYEEYKKYKEWQKMLGCENAEEVIDFVMSNYLTEDEKCRTIADQAQQIKDLEKENKRLSKNLKLSRVQKENFYNNLLEKDLEKLKVNLHEFLFNRYGCDEKVPVFNLKIIIDDVIDYSKPCFKRRK